MRISDLHLKNIYAHAKETYPYECLGFLVGTFDDGGMVHQVVRGTNLNTEQADRFEMDPSEFVQVEKQADNQGLNIIGFYHSHPDWPAIPSQTDINWAWEESYYLIVSVHDGRPFNSGVWLLSEAEPKCFKQELLEILDENVLPLLGS
jgi:proteasome lid subunit RPN8/RPN11